MPVVPMHRNITRRPGALRPRTGLVVLMLGTLLCQPAPCIGWWGKERASAAGTIGVDSAKAKAVESWRIANETNVNATDMLTKAALLDEAAQEAQAAVDAIKKGGLFKKKASTEEIHQREFEAKEAQILGWPCKPVLDLGSGNCVSSVTWLTQHPRFWQLQRLDRLPTHW